MKTRVLIELTAEACIDFCILDVPELDRIAGTNHSCFYYKSVCTGVMKTMHLAYNCEQWPQ